MGEMNARELKNLGRKDLLEMLLLQSQEIERLSQEVNVWKEKADSHELMVQNAGSMAEAALSVNNVFKQADAAARAYANNVSLQKAEAVGQRMVEKTQAQCAAVLENTKKKAVEIMSKTKLLIDRSYAEANERSKQIVEHGHMRAELILSQARDEAEKIVQSARREDNAVKSVQDRGKTMSWKGISDNLQDLYRQIDEVDALLGNK